VHQYLIAGENSARLPTEKDKRQHAQTKIKKILFKPKKNLFFTVRRGKQQNRLPREAGETPSLEKFKTQLDIALSHVLYLTLF